MTMPSKRAVHTTIPSWLDHQTFDDIRQLLRALGDANPRLRQVCRRVAQDLCYIELFQSGEVRRRRGGRQ